MEVEDEEPAAIITGDGAVDVPEEDPIADTVPAASQATAEEKIPPTEHRLEPVPESDDDALHIPKPEEDSASLHSTSSRSFFRPGSLRRKATDRSNASSNEKERPQRSRRASEAKSEEEVSGLGIAVEMEIQGGRSGWGVGDEARMSLE